MRREKKFGPFTEERALLSHSVFRIVGKTVGKNE
jgi:hypothetical protein